MNSRMRTAVDDAMTLLRSQNVLGATHAIQRALSGATPQVDAQSADNQHKTVGFKSQRQPLGDVLNQLREGRLKAAANARGTTRKYEAKEGLAAHRYNCSAGKIGYKLHVPADHAKRDLSLVLMLHGCTQDPDDFARGTQMNRLADEFGLVVAYPHQPRASNAQGCWNWFDRRHQQRDAGEPAVLAGLARELAQQFGIPDGRIFAAGLSAGGAMADILAAAYSETFSAVGVHSGLPSGAANDVISAFKAMKGETSASRPPVGGRGCRKIIIHGGADGTVHASNGEQILAQLHTQSPRSALLKTESTVNGRRVTRTLLDDADGCSLAEHWLIHGASHAWSGGDSSGSYTDPSGPDASREMVRFFLKG